MLPTGLGSNLDAPALAHRESLQVRPLRCRTRGRRRRRPRSAQTRFAMGRSERGRARLWEARARRATSWPRGSSRQTGDRLARSERRKVMSPSLPAGGFTCADGQAVRGGARGRVRACGECAARRLDHRLGQGLREHGMAHRSGQSELLLEAVEERLDRVVVDAPARAARGAERRVTERRARGWSGARRKLRTCRRAGLSPWRRRCPGGRAGGRGTGARRRSGRLA